MSERGIKFLPTRFFFFDFFFILSSPSPFFLSLSPSFFTSTYPLDLPKFDHFASGALFIAPAPTSDAPHTLPAFNQYQLETLWKWFLYVSGSHFRAENALFCDGFGMGGFCFIFFTWYISFEKLPYFIAYETQKSVRCTPVSLHS